MDSEADAYRKTLFLDGAVGGLSSGGNPLGVLGGIAAGVLSGRSPLFDDELKKMRTEPTKPDFSDMTPEEIGAWWERAHGTTS